MKQYLVSKRIADEVSDLASISIEEFAEAYPSEMEILPPNARVLTREQVEEAMDAQFCHCPQTMIRDTLTILFGKEKAK